MALKLLQELTLDPQAHPPYTLLNGIIRYNNRVWVGKNKELQLRIFQGLHTSALGGHSGFLVMYIKI